MYADLFHLYPTDSKVNGNRGDLPFGETNGSNKNSANDFSKIGTCTYPGYTGTVFEPNDIYKGDFARTYFYMVTCYEEKLPDWVNKGNASITIDGSKYPGLTAWQLEMLMKWAKNDPVSEKEINRNNAVYNIQKNRNPFIDYPGLEEYIWGDKKDVAFSYDNYATSIQDITTSGVQDVKQDIYGADGQLRRTYQRGLNIVKQENGRTYKIIRR
jgi:endonuclease I